MLHKNAVKMVEEAGGVVTTYGLAHHEATLNGHFLAWSVDGWTNRLVKVGYTPRDCKYGRAWVLVTGRRVSNSTLLKQFIQVAAEQSWVTDGCRMRLEFGPDASHPKLKKSVRACFPGWPGGPSCQVFEAKAVDLCESVVVGLMPPEAMLDWLKDKGFLEEVREEACSMN